MYYFLFIIVGIISPSYLETKYAKSLGINVKVRLIGMTIASLTAVIVSFYGVISFVGLAVPHIVRQIIGNDEQYLIPHQLLVEAFSFTF